MRGYFALLVSASMLGACTTTTSQWVSSPLAVTHVPDPVDMGQAAPANWAASVPQGMLADRTGWLASFHDAQLQSLVNEALAHNHTLAAAEESVKQAQALAVSARAARLPSVSVGATGTGTSIPGTADTDSYAGAVSAGWELDLWGRLADRHRAARSDLHAVQDDYADLALAIAGQTASAWVDLVAADQQVKLSRDEVMTRERSLKLIERRYRSGVSSSLDVRLGRSALASAKAGLAFQQQQRNNATRRLEVLLGRYPADRVQAAAVLPEPGPLQNPGNPADLLARRPDVRAAEARLTAAGFRVSDARKAILPSLSLTASGSTGGGRFSDIFDLDGAVGQLIGSFTQPVFAGGAIRANTKRVESIARQRMETYAQTTLTAWREVEDAIDGETWLTAREAALSVAVREAKEAERLSERSYTNGVGTIFELLDAQRRRISAQSQLITARASRVNNRIALYMALGGDDATMTAQTVSNDEGSQS